MKTARLRRQPSATPHAWRAPGLLERCRRYGRSLFTKSSQLRELDASLELGEVMPNIPEMGRFFSSMGTALQIATEGRASAQKVLHDAATTIGGE
jgi:maltose-binding protein MalE